MNLILLTESYSWLILRTLEVFPAPTCRLVKSCITNVTHTESSRLIKEVYPLVATVQEAATRRDSTKKVLFFVADIDIFINFLVLEKQFKILGHLKKKLSYGWGSTVFRLEPICGGSLLFTPKFPKISGTHFINLGRMSGLVDRGATQWFWTRDPWIRNLVP